MKLFNYNGETPAEALKAARRRHGDEALVVSTKEIRQRSLTQPALYEIVVAVEDEKLPPPEEPQPQKSNNVSERYSEIVERERQKRKNMPNIPTPVFSPSKDSRLDDVSLQLSDAVREISKIANLPQKGEKEEPKRSAPEPKKSAPEMIVTPPPARGASTPTPTKSVTREEIQELKIIRSEIDKLNDKIKLIQNMFWEEKGPKRDGLVIPHEFAEIYRIAKNSGMKQEHLDKIMHLTLDLMPVQMRESSILIKRYFHEVLRKMIYCRHESLESGGRKIIMLVGPTGVGKTTTLAKLAARYSRMLNKSYKVGIITLDTYRIGAVDQLMFYAKKMKLSIDTVIDPAEFASALNSLRHCDYILIDTVGSSQHDRQKIDLLKNYVNSEPHSSIDVSLVVSATTKHEDLKDVYHAFSSLNIDTMILTKLDETRGFGNLFSLIHETKKPVSYFSVGQEVPNDLIVASSEYLVGCLLNGFKKAEK